MPGPRAEAGPRRLGMGSLREVMNRLSNEFWADLERGCLKCQSRNVIITLLEAAVAVEAAAAGKSFICLCGCISAETTRPGRLV